MWAPVVAVRGLSSCGSWTREHRLNSCGSWAWLLCGMWNLPRPRIESVPPALAGRFFTTESPGKPGRWIFIHCTTREVPSVLNNLATLFKEEKGTGDINCAFPNGSWVRNPPSDTGDVDLISGLGRFPWRRKWQPPPVFLPGKSHGSRSLTGYSPWDHKESDTN